MWISKKKYNKTLRDLETQLNIKHQEELEEAKKLTEREKLQINLIAEKIVNLEWTEGQRCETRKQIRALPNLRLVMEFSSFCIEQLLDHGNDEHFIDYISHYIGNRAAAEMKRRNIVRIPEDYKKGLYGRY